ncbi:MAG: hypothetical protein ACKOEP_09260, partial [Phycisphaerales bacterium]
MSGPGPVVALRVRPGIDPMPWLRELWQRGNTVLLVAEAQPDATRTAMMAAAGARGEVDAGLGAPNQAAAATPLRAADHPDDAGVLVA